MDGLAVLGIIPVMLSLALLLGIIYWGVRVLRLLREIRDALREANPK